MRKKFAIIAKIPKLTELDIIKLGLWESGRIIKNIAKVLCCYENIGII